MSHHRTRKLAEEISGSCLNTRVRTLSRVVSAIYDEELRPAGIKSSQLNLLVAVATAGPVRRIDIGRYLHLDASTLTRNLAIMEKNGWIKEVDDRSDGRGSPVDITSAGEAILAAVAPAWRSAQRRTSRLLGSESKDSLLAIADAVTG